MVNPARPFPGDHPVVFSPKKHIGKHMANLKAGFKRLHILDEIYHKFMRYDEHFVATANFCVEDGIINQLYGVALQCIDYKFSTEADLLKGAPTRLAEKVEELGITAFLNHMATTSELRSKWEPAGLNEREMHIHKIKYAEKEILVKSLYIMGMICFNNKEATDKVASASELVGLLTHTMEKIYDGGSDDDGEKVLKASLYLMCNLTANSFESHDKVIQLLTQIRRVLSSRSLPASLRSEAVRVCFYLSANDVNKDALINSGVVPPLVEIMEECTPWRSTSGNNPQALDCTSAIITIANIIGDHHDHPALEALDAKSLVNCFEACLQGSDYPRNSNLFYRNWKVAKGLCKLAASPGPRERLRKHGLGALLNKALAGDDTDNQMHRYTLILAWHLSGVKAQVLMHKL